MKFSLKTIKGKLIAYNLFLIITIALFISYYNYNSYRNDIISSEISNSIIRTHTISDRSQLAYNEMMNIALNCSERKSLFLSLSLSDLNRASAKRMALYASDVLKDYLAISGYSKYVSKITLYSKDRILLQAGSLHGNYNDSDVIMNTNWFLECLNKDMPNYTLSLEDSPFSYASKISFLPIVRPLNHEYLKSPENAWILIAISPKLYDSLIKETYSDKTIYAMTKEGDMITTTSLTEGALSNVISVIKTKVQQNSSGNFNALIENKPSVISYTYNAQSGVTIFEVLPYDSIVFDKSVIIRTIIFVFIWCMCIGTVLSIYISYQIGKPIQKLVKRIKIISAGDFTLDNSIESNDEIGLIGKQINKMSQHISELMNSRIKAEKEKRYLEINMLQAQINPHFLYNTLDSVKWIATMQKSSGIVQVVTSLSALLKNMAKGFNEKVTLRKEIEFLNDYIIIEKIRYIELFDVDIHIAEELYDAKIIKLTLQPLVENAIFSGIEPSLRNGLIKIHAYKEEENLVITVTDDGIGISSENIHKLLTDSDCVNKSTMSGIGLPNVDKRFKLVYGSEYGLSIESEQNKYTKIKITLPLEYD